MREGRGRSTLQTAATPTAVTALMTKRIASARCGPLYMSWRSWTPPPYARRQQRSRASLRRGRVREDLIPCRRRYLLLNRPAGNLTLDLLGLTQPVRDQRSPPPREAPGAIGGEEDRTLGLASLTTRGGKEFKFLV